MSHELKQLRGEKATVGSPKADTSDDTMANLTKLQKYHNSKHKRGQSRAFVAVAANELLKPGEDADAESTNGVELSRGESSDSVIRYDLGAEGKPEASPAKSPTTRVGGIRGPKVKEISSIFSPKESPKEGASAAPQPSIDSDEIELSAALSAQQLELPVDEFSTPENMTPEPASPVAEAEAEVAPKEETDTAEAVPDAEAAEVVPDAEAAEAVPDAEAAEVVPDAEAAEVVPDAEAAASTEDEDKAGKKGVRFNEKVDVKTFSISLDQHKFDAALKKLAAEDGTATEAPSPEGGSASGKDSDREIVFVFENEDGSISPSSSTGQSSTDGDEYDEDEEDDEEEEDSLVFTPTPTIGNPLDEPEAEVPETVVEAADESEAVPGAEVKKKKKKKKMGVRFHENLEDVQMIYDYESGTEDLFSPTAVESEPSEKGHRHVRSPDGSALDAILNEVLALENQQNAPEDSPQPGEEGEGGVDTEKKTVKKKKGRKLLKVFMRKKKSDTNAHNDDESTSGSSTMEKSADELSAEMCMLINALAET
ncbi:unnamed protein product [Chrysoparadoxa australica]